MRRLFAGTLAVLLVAACGRGGAVPRAPGPVAVTVASGAASAVRPGQRAEGRNGMVAASHPLAAEAGLEMLRRGGNAIDAAVATAFAIGVLEPMMGGLGGGGSLVLWLANEGRAEHLEFYPALGAEPDYTLEEDSIVTPERGVNVPGTVAGLLSALERWGSLPRGTVMEPAVRLARDGFVVHPLLARVIADNEEKLTHTPEAAAIFYPAGEPLQAGDRLVQTRLAATMDAIRRYGPDAFYRGAIAGELVDALRPGGSTLTLDDFSRYAPADRRPVCGEYHGHVVLTSAPPMGGVELLLALNLIAPYDLRRLGAPAASGPALSLVVDAMRIARADRGAWIGDPDDSGVPAAGLASPAFAEERRHLVGAPPPDTLEPGDPWQEDRAGVPAACAVLDAYPPAALPPPATEAGPGPADGIDAETTHLSVVDGEGNAVALTFTMGLYFGTGAYAAGMFLNSGGYNFGDEGANVRAPYRTPASTTAPTIVLEAGEPRLVVGSPGSGRIPPAILHTMVYTLDFGYDLARAVAMPRVYPWFTRALVQVEDGISPEALAELRRRGYEVRAHPPSDMFFGGISAIHVRRDGLMIGVADPRRNGGARGF